MDNQVLGAAEPVLRNDQQTPTHEVVMKNSLQFSQGVTGETSVPVPLVS